MAEFTVTFKDVEEGVIIEAKCDKQIPDEVTEEFLDSLTDAERLGVRMKQLIEQECFSHDDCSNDCCSGDCTGNCKTS